MKETYKHFKKFMDDFHLTFEYGWKKIDFHSQPDGTWEKYRLTVESKRFKIYIEWIDMGKVVSFQTESRSFNLRVYHMDGVTNRGSMMISEKYKGDSTDVNETRDIYMKYLMEDPVFAELYKRKSREKKLKRITNG